MGIFDKKNDKLSFTTDPKTLHKNLGFAATEQYKLLRANLDFTLPLGTKCPVVGVTSSTRAEGKSTTSINLSYVFAEKGSKVLLIDGDLRLPSVAKKMQLKNEYGLTDLLMDGEVDIARFQCPEIENWYVLTSGKIPPNPSELLGSDRMGSILEALREQFDYIIVDLPPVNMVSDALAVSKWLTGMLVVVREEHTEKKDLDRCFTLLRLSDVNILGCVMTGIKTAEGKYKYKKYKRYGYSYGYGSNSKKGNS